MRGLLLQALEGLQVESGDTGDAVAALGELPQPAEPFHVVIGIEPLTTFGPVGSDYSIAPLPSPEDVRGEAGATGYQPDRMERRVEAAVSIHGTTLVLCLSNVKSIICTRA
jgi:hypothetical protein